MEVKWLEDFLTLAETKSFSHSARKRDLSQSAFSKRIVLLEEWMGAKLIDRSVQPISLTPAGRMFHGPAKEILKSIYAARMLVGGREQYKGTEPVIQLAVTPTLVSTSFPIWLRKLNHLGRVNARVQPVGFTVGVQQLVDGESDLFISYYHPLLSTGLDPDLYPYLCLGIERVVPVSAVASDGVPLFLLPGSANHPLPLLTYTPGSFLGDVVDLLLLNAVHPFELYRAFETPAAEALKGMVLAGQGIAWMPESYLSKELSDGTVVNVGSNIWTTELEIRIHRSLRRRGQVADRVWAFIENMTVEPGAGKVSLED